MAKEDAAKNPRRTGARARLRARRRARANPSGGGGARANPPILTDFTHVLLPGFGAYAVTRFLQRIAYTLAAKKWPRAAKHIHALSGAAAFGAAWMFAHKVKAAAPYHDGIVVGSGIAALQGVAQTYLPKYAWMTSDVNGASVPASLAAKAAGAQALPSSTAGDEYSFLEDELAAPPRSRTVPAPRRGSNASTLRMAAQATGDGGDGVDVDLMEELGDNESLDDLGGGIFDGGSLSN